MQRRLFVTSARHFLTVEGSKVWPSTSPCLIRVEVAIRMPDCVTIPNAFGLPGIRKRPMVRPDARGHVLVALPPSVTISTYQEEFELGEIAASWVRAALAELAKHGINGIDLNSIKRLEWIVIPADQVARHPDDQGDGMLEFDLP